jgi:hypothetical protein
MLTIKNEIQDNLETLKMILELTEYKDISRIMELREDEEIEILNILGDLEDKNIFLKNTAIKYLAMKIEELNEKL